MTGESLGVPVASLGRSESYLWVRVSATNHFVMYTKGIIRDFAISLVAPEPIGKVETSSTKSDLGPLEIVNNI